jgi:inosine-uridine nucleoside N-ribohydrolase
LKIHLDTDLGGDPDDACALVFLLSLPFVEIVGITTNLDHGGFRAGCVRYYLTLAGRSDIPVESGAGVTLTDLKRYDSTAADPRYWPEPINPAPAVRAAGLDLLMGSIEEGATIVAIGAATNLALLEILRPGSLGGARVVFMGGWIHSPAAGLPNMGPDADWNVQCDSRAASVLFDCADLTLVPLSVTLQTWLRASHLPHLRQAGSVGELLARQSELYAIDNRRSELAAAHAGLPHDLLNFHHDPLTAAVAVMWSGVETDEMRLKQIVADNGTLRFERSSSGRRTRVVVDVDSEGFSEHWLTTIISAAL